MNTKLRQRRLKTKSKSEVKTGSFVFAQLNEKVTDLDSSFMNNEEKAIGKWPLMVTDTWKRKNFT